MTYPDFSKLKQLALSCRSKRDGKMLTASFRLWYDGSTNSVKLISRYNQTLFMQTFADSVTRIMIPNHDITGWMSQIIINTYGVRFKTIQGHPGIKQHNSHTIILNDERYIYIPTLTEIRDGKLVRIANYYEDILDTKWKNEYAQTSKKNRAAFTALHKIIPFAAFTRNNDMSNYQYRNMLYSWSANYHDIIRIVDLVMTTPEPTAIDIETVRNTLKIFTNKVNLRTLLQRLVNEQRYERANRDGKITLVSTPNYAR